MRYKNREYGVVIWDWLWTVYSRKDGRLFNWVIPYFEKHGKDSRNYLVSYAYNPTKRIKMIQDFGISKYFEDIKVARADKEELFNDVINIHKLEKEDILVIGDNVLHEGVASNKLGLDFLPIAVWNEFVYTSLDIRPKKN